MTLFTLRSTHVTIHIWAHSELI